MPFFRRLAFATFLLGASLTVASHAEGALQRFAFEKPQMGVPFRITLYAFDEAKAKAAADAAFKRVEELNSILSDYDPDSELSRLSRTSGHGKAVQVSEDLWHVLKLSQEMAERSAGGFDITIGPLVETWRRARRKHELPPADVIAAMRERVGYQYLRLDPAANTAELLLPDMRLDLGGIAKGYAVDEALKVLKAHGIDRALVAASGDIGAGEAPPDKPGWRVEIAPLDAPDAPPARFVWLRYSAVSTAGDTFQRLEINGVRYSHIVDPHTGIGLTDHSLATVIGPNCATTDSLETTLCLLGPERGLKLIESTPGAAAYVVRKPGEKIEVHTSSRWDELGGLRPAGSLK